MCTIAIVIQHSLLNNYFIQHSFWNTSYQRRKRNTINPNWEKKKTVTVCRCHNTIHRVPKVTTRKLLELINDFGKVGGCKVNMLTSIPFLYTRNKRLEGEIQEIISFNIASERIKYLGIYLLKETKDMCLEITAY